MLKHTPGRPTSGVRRSPRKQRDYSIIDNAALTDKRLSYRSRGILAYILSKPDDWRTSSESIAREGTEGRDAVRTALRELREFGYMVTERVRDPETGQISTVSTVYEQPIETVHTPVPPKPENRASRDLHVGESGDNQRTDYQGLKQTTTQTSERKQRKPRAMSAVVVGSTSDERLKPLAAACLGKGLPAVWGTLSREKADTIAELLAVHGVEALVDHAVKMHTPANPTRHAGGLLITWQSMPLPRAKAPLKSDCDRCENGWYGADYDQPCPTCRPNIARGAA